MSANDDEFYKNCAHVYVPSPSVGDTLVSDGILGDNLRFWSRGIDKTRFSPAHRDMAWRRAQGIADDDVALTFVGRLVREKGLNVYVSLFEKLKERGLSVKALVVGGGPERKALQRKLPDAVMVGHLSGNALARAYASGDIFINPSLTETFGNVTLEAMASGLPTVCLEATGSIDLVDHGTTGLLIKSAKCEDWVAGTAELCRDKLRRERMGQAALHASKNYDWDIIMGKLLSQYLELTGGRYVPQSVAAE